MGQGAVSVRGLCTIWPANWVWKLWMEETRGHDVIPLSRSLFSCPWNHINHHGPRMRFQVCNKKWGRSGNGKSAITCKTWKMQCEISVCFRDSYYNTHKPEQRERENTTSALNQHTGQSEGAAGAELTGMSQHWEILHLDSLVSQSKRPWETSEKHTLNNVHKIHIRTSLISALWLFLTMLPTPSKECSCANLPLPMPTCFHGRDYRKDRSSSRPEGTAQGCMPAPFPLPSHTFLEEEKPWWYSHW